MMERALRSIISADGGIARAYSNRNYRLYTGGNILSLIGTWVQRVGVGYLMWNLTHSYEWLGYLSAAEFLPSLLAGPLGGVVADRMDRLSVIRISQVLQGLQALISRPTSGPAAPNWKPYLDKLPNDPWGRPYQYLNPGVKGEVDVMSFGADGQAGGEGRNADIGSWQ